MEQALTLANLQRILENHTHVLVRRFTAILEANNERMGEYVQESIEAVSALQVRHNHIQADLRQSLEGVGDSIIREITSFQFDKEPPKS